MYDYNIRQFSPDVLWNGIYCNSPRVLSLISLLIYQGKASSGSFYYIKKYNEIASKDHRRKSIFFCDALILESEYGKSINSQYNFHYSIKHLSLTSKRTTDYRFLFTKITFYFLWHKYNDGFGMNVWTFLEFR